MHDVTVNGTRLGYTDDGPRSGPVLVLSHSLFFSSAMFHHQVAAFGLDQGIGDCAHQVIHREPVLDELAGCTVPLLAVAGEQDHAYSIENSRAVADAAKAGHLAVVPRAGHSVSLEQPGVVNVLLQQHLDAATA